jgi:hypothetical protein
MLPQTSQQEQEGPTIGFGLAPILKTLESTANNRSASVWNLFLINIETIIRNRGSIGKDNYITPEEIMNDCNLLTQYISAYVRDSDRTQRQKAIVAFYSTHYESMPSIYLKEKFPKGTEERWALRDAFEKYLDRNYKGMSYDNLDVHFGICEKGGWPYQSLFKDLSKLDRSIKFRNVAMISHVPGDFLIYKNFAKFSLLESFTGGVKSVKEFGEKVFGDPELPFTKHVYMLFGDKVYIKGILDNKDKRRAKEIAKTQHWRLTTDRNILESILQNKLDPSLTYQKW